MAARTKRTTTRTGNTRYTNTTSVNNGKTKTTRSQSSTNKTTPGMTRVTTSYSNGKTNTIRTTNMGGGWYTRTSSAGEDRRREAEYKRNRKRLDKSNKDGSALQGMISIMIIFVLVLLAANAFVGP